MLRPPVMLGILLLTALVMGVIALRPILDSDRAEESKAIRKALQKRQGRIPLPEGFDVKFTEMEPGKWRSTGPTRDKDLLDLIRKETVKNLEIRLSEVTARGFRELAKQPLLTLEIGRQSFDDGVVEAILKIPTLQVLNIRRCGRLSGQSIGKAARPNTRIFQLIILESELTGDGLARMIQLLPNLESLDVRGVRETTVASLKGLPGLKRLKELQIHDSDLEEGCAEQIKNCAGVSSLELNNCGITDDDLISISGMRHLARLAVLKNPITDAGLVGISKMRNLRSLNIAGCSTVTDRGLARLRSRLPSTTITTKLAKRKKNDSERLMETVFPELVGK